MALSALRVTDGMRLSWSALSVDETVAVCVLMSSALLATVIVSSSWPSSSCTFTSKGCPGSRRTFGRTAVLKPDKVTLTVYVPGFSDGREKTPCALVTVVNEPPAASVTTTLAPGMAPPLVSTTVPVMDEEAPPPCA